MSGFESINNESEFSALVEQLKVLLKPVELKSVGLFEWETITKPNGRKKTIYIIKKIISRENNTSNLLIHWFLNYSNSHLSLIIDSKIANMGDVTLLEFQRKNGMLYKKNERILKLR